MGLPTFTHPTREHLFWLLAVAPALQRYERFRALQPAADLSVNASDTSVASDPSGPSQDDELDATIAVLSAKLGARLISDEAS